MNAKELYSLALDCFIEGRMLDVAVFFRVLASGNWYNELISLGNDEEHSEVEVNATIDFMIRKTAYLTN